MYERFTDGARRVMMLANQVAKKFNHEYIGTEHLLWGILNYESSLAVYVLKKYCSISHIQSNLETKMRTASTIANLPERLPNTPRTKKAIEYAIEESRNFGHSYVGVEHLLLGLLRENSGIAGTILMSYSGLDANSARKDLQIILQCEEKRSTGRIFVISPPMSDALIMLIRQELSLPDNAVLEEIIVKVE